VLPGEILLITDGNGAGKSALIKAIYGLLPGNQNGVWNERQQRQSNRTKSQPKFPEVVLSRVRGLLPKSDFRHFGVAVLL
jgi:ABC-type transport system involved in cytochrome c biogenesis ATPase subunit